jgi:hypothetical protein
MAVVRQRERRDVSLDVEAFEEFFEEAIFPDGHGVRMQDRNGNGESRVAKFAMASSLDRVDSR